MSQGVRVLVGFVPAAEALDERASALCFLSVDHTVPVRVKACEVAETGVLPRRPLALAVGPPVTLRRPLALAVGSLVALLGTLPLPLGSSAPLGALIGGASTRAAAIGQGLATRLTFLLADLPVAILVQALEDGVAQGLGQ
jgi:hypothetical protein